MDPRKTWMLGALVGGVLFVACFIAMVLIGPRAARAQPWKLGCLGFGAVALVSSAGIVLTRKRD